MLAKNRSKVMLISLIIEKTRLMLATVDTDKDVKVVITKEELIEFFKLETIEVFFLRELSNTCIKKGCTLDFSTEGRYIINIPIIVLMPKLAPIPFASLDILEEG